MPEHARELYYFWRTPTDGLPEFNSGGHVCETVPGCAQWVLLHAGAHPELAVPTDAIPASDVVQFLESRRE